VIFKNLLKINFAYLTRLKLKNIVRYNFIFSTKTAMLYNYAIILSTTSKLQI